MITITIKSFITGRVTTFALTIKKALDLGYPGKLFPGVNRTQVQGRAH